MIDKKKLLVTGSCGFIFGNFLRQAVYEKHPYHLISVDKVNTNTINSMYWNKNHTFHIADVRDSHVINTIFQLEKPEIVIHGAAETFNDSFQTNSSNYVSSNVLGTQVILDACIKHNVQKLIYISTSEVYGQLSSESDKPWLETDQLSPRNVYAATKAAGELLVKSNCESSGLKYNIIRGANNYGPRQSTNKLIPKIIKCILENKPIPIYGQGLQVRDWIHVQDYCLGIFNILQHGKDNETYNISSSQEYCNVEIAMHVCNAMNKGHDLISYVQDPRNPHDFRRAIDANKLRNLGWKPKVNFKRDVKDLCIDWYLNNQWWFK